MEGFDDFSLITKLARDELIRVLESIAGSKELVVEAGLMRPLDKIASMSLLQRHGCLRVQQLHMDKAVVWDDSLEYGVFLVRPTVAVAKKICELISADPSRRYSIVLVDRRRNFFDAELERHGLYGSVEFHEFNLMLVPLESDLFSLEMPASTSKVHHYEEQAMAKVLWQLQSIYGLIPTTFGVGEASKRVDTMLKDIFADMGEPPASADQPISHAFLFDRLVDMASPLMTSLTYESMLNDTFHYNCGKINFGERVEAKLKSRSHTPARTKALALNNSDVIFSAIRNEHMTSVFQFLSAKAKMLQVSVDRASALNNVEEVKSFVSNELKSLKDQQSQLEIHISACEVVMEMTRESSERFALEQSTVQGEADADQLMSYLEFSMYKQTNPWHVLQLICLWSLREDGLATKHYQTLQRTFLQAYGYEYMSALYQLRRRGLFFERRSASPTTVIASSISHAVGSIHSPTTASFRESASAEKRSPFSTMESSLGLCPSRFTTPTPTPNTENEGKKKLMGYVFSDAYTPVIAQLLSTTATEGWNEARLKRAFGSEKPIFTSNAPSTKPDNRIRKALLVSFIGGVTYAEVAALRCFAQNHDFRVIILATNVINRVDFLKGLAEF